jgi:iron complex transport system ATP-binding protein
LRESALDTVVSGKFSAVGLNRLLYERPTAADYSVARQKLDGVGMSDLADRPFGVLSQGERQKTLLARAQMAAPLLLVLDEPCVGLDPGSRESFLSALETIAQDENSPSLLLVTHHIEEIVPALLNTLVMDAGRIIDRGPTADLLNLESANRLYDGRVQRIVWENGRCWPICG